MADTGTVNQVNGTETNNQERTFTQAEVDAIVQGRIAKERDKFSDYEELKGKASKLDEIEEANKTELQKANEKNEELQREINDMKTAAQVRSIREKVSSETGVPIKLLNANTEEECKAIADEILAFKGQAQYPSVKDGGEAAVSTGITKEEILAIKSEKQRLKAIEENIELFT